VDRFTENARLVRNEPNHQNLEPAARQFEDHSARATALINRLNDSERP
jgi:hypothetical protein